MVQADDPEESRLHEAIERSFALAGGMRKLIAGESQQLYSSDRICIPWASLVRKLSRASFPSTLL